jgi:hypothetical protein
MQLLLDSASLLVVAAGVLVLLASARSGSWRTSLPVAMELWTGAGLLRLSGAPSWARIGTAVVIVAVRRLVLARIGRPRDLKTVG